MLAGIRQIYRDSLKPADSVFNLYLARPLAAPLVQVFCSTPITPNQITFVSLAVMVVAVAALAGLEGAAGLWLGILGIELSYVFDCVDGQLARITGRTSSVGALLDFLMDELKAYMLVAAIATRWSIHDGGGEYALWIGVITLVVLGSALSVTKFTRTVEYAEATGTRQLRHGEASGAGRTRSSSPLFLAEAAARIISQYPQSLPVFAILGYLDVFMYAYLVVHMLYLGRTTLNVLVRLGGFAPSGSR